MSISACRRLCLCGYFILVAMVTFSGTGWAQQEDCGAHALRECLRRLNFDVSTIQVVQNLETIPPRASLLDLKCAAEEFGVEAKFHTLELDDLKQVSKSAPGVAHVDGNHFVAVWMETSDDVVVVDSPAPPRMMSLRDFGRHWDGNILIVSQLGNQPRFVDGRYWFALGAFLMIVAIVTANILLRKRSLKYDAHN